MTGLRSKQVYHEDHCRSSNSVLNQTLFKLPDIRHNEKIQYKGILESYRADQRSKKATNSGDTETSKSKFHIEDVYNSKEQRRAPPNFQPSRIELVHKDKALPANFPGNSARFFSNTGLDGKDRPVSSLFSRSHCGITSLLPKIGIQRRDSSDDLFAIRPSLCTQDLCSVNELDCGDLSSSRISGFSLSRRFSPGLPGPVQVVVTGFGSCEHLGILGMAGQLSEVSSQADPTNRILRHNLEHQQQHNVPIKKETGKDLEVSRFHFGQTKLQSETDSEVTGTAKLRKLRNSQGSSALSTSTNIFASL